MKWWHRRPAGSPRYRVGLTPPARQPRVFCLSCTCGSTFGAPVHQSAQETLTRNWYSTHCGPGHGSGQGPDVFARLADLAEEMKAELAVAEALELAR